MNAHDESDFYMEEVRKSIQCFLPTLAKFVGNVRYLLKVIPRSLRHALHPCSLAIRPPVPSQTIRMEVGSAIRAVVTQERTSIIVPHGCLHRPYPPSRAWPDAAARNKNIGSISC